jgi:anti-sigma regulatory factor (Ser/Thr protein kinase)
MGHPTEIVTRRIFRPGCRHDPRGAQVQHEAASGDIVLGETWGGRDTVGSVDLSLSAQPASVPAARQLVRQRCEDWGADSAASDAAVLLASELVTNAVLHARTPMTLTVAAGEGTIRVEVRDWHPALPQARRYNVDTATGRGLRLLETIASAWGVLKVPSAAQPGKIVWFEVPLVTDASVDEALLAAAFQDVLVVEWLADPALDQELA